MELESYKTKLIRVQRLINIKIAKAYRTVSNGALCILIGMTPIAIKIEEAAQIYQLTSGNTKGEEAQVDSHMGVKHWQHPAETITRILEDTDERSPIQIFSNGSKTEKGVGAGITIFKLGHHINPYPTAFPYGNGMVLHFYQQQESSTTKTVFFDIFLHRLEPPL